MSAAPPNAASQDTALEQLRSLLLGRAKEMRDAIGERSSINPLLDFELDKRRVSENHSEAATLAKLFLLSMPVSKEDAERALAPLAPAALAELGLATLEEAVVRPLARVVPYEGVLVTSDILQGPQAPDFVTGPSAAARRVDRLTIRRPVKRALDLGTGQGIQALRTAGHAEEVVAVDVSDRALAFARFNASLNGVSNIDIRQGDWFEPVAGERFDLIVANPPYVVSPESDLLYRDGDLPGDAVTKKLLREAPEHLEEGGFAQVMGNWIHGRNEDWRAPVEACVAGAGCDALLLRYPVTDLVSYAALWNLLLSTSGSKEYLQAIDRWLDFYEREGIDAISDGMVVLRRRSDGVNWVRAIEVPASPTGAAGDHVLRMFAARDRRDELAGDEAVLSARFTLAPGLKLSWSAEGPGVAERKAKVGLENGVGFAVSIGPAIAELIGSFDGSHRLESLGDGEHELAATLRRLFALGLVSASAE